MSADRRFFISQVFQSSLQSYENQSHKHLMEISRLPK